MFYVVEIFLIENQQSATDDRRGPCLYVDSKTDGAKIKVTGCNDTDEKQNWAYTLKGQIMVSLVQPLKPNSNDQLISPCNITKWSYLLVMRIKKTVIKDDLTCKL